VSLSIGCCINKEEALAVNQEKKKASGLKAVFWWLVWITVTILSFFVSAFFWTRVLANHVGPMSQSGMPVLWIAAVFGSWMVLLVPLIVIMYQKVDRAYEDARIRRETMTEKRLLSQIKCRSANVEEEQRLLNEPLRAKLKTIPEIVKHGQLVRLALKDGRSIDNAFIIDKRELIGIYDLENCDFISDDIVDLAAMDLDKLPEYDQERWLRLDGVGGRP